MQANLLINVDDDDLQYRHTFIQLKYVRKEIQLKYPDLCKEYRLNGSKIFNSQTGEIVWKYAWDSIYAILWKDGRLAKILNKLIRSVK